MNFQKFMFVATTVSLVVSTAVSGAADSKPQKDNKGKILVIISSENELALQQGKKHSTGYYFNELIVPVKHLVEAGYEVEFANPKGNKPTMDASSDSPSKFGDDKVKYQAYKEFHSKLDKLQAPKKLADVVKYELNSYKGLFVPGGHAPMIDLLKDNEVRTILHHFHANKKPTALICHGPIALLAVIPKADTFVAALDKGKTDEAKKIAKDWIYTGYRMTIFSTPEEKVAEQQIGGKVSFYPDVALEAAGGNVSRGKEWQSHVIRDRELITGQNPASDEELTQVFLKALAE